MSLRLRFVCGAGSRQGGGGGFQSSSNRLAENSALREAENEVINIITKVSLDLNTER